MKTSQMQIMLISIAILAIAPLGSTATLHVPTDFPTIQQAIDNAVAGDTVLVEAGDYVENIDFLGKAISVMSSDGAKKTVIDGNQSGSVVVFKNGEGPDSILEGFTIRNGTGTLDLFSGCFIGGGIYCYATSPTMRYNIVIENDAEHAGGIGCVWGGAPTILGNTISGNTVIGETNSAGGGIMCSRNVTALISENVIIGNTVTGTGHPTHGATGGAVHVSYDSICTVTNNILMGNKAEYGGGIACVGNGAYVFMANNVVAINTVEGGYTGEGSAGGGILISVNASGTVCGNLVYDNKAVVGGGFACARVSSGVFTNNTVYRNEATLRGGGISCYIQSSLEARNNIIWDNISPAVSGPEVRVGSNSSIDIDYSDVKGGAGDVLVDPLGTLIWGTNNIDADPLFAAVLEEDFHLKYTSPCRDTGDNGAIPVGFMEDFEGDPRCCGIVDMGCDEFSTHLYVTGDKTPGGVIHVKIVGLPGAYPVGLFVGSGVLPSPVNTMWGEFWLQPPWILFLMLPPGIPSDGILVITKTLPLSIPAPYDVPLQALIDPEFTNLYVLEVR